MHIVLEWINRIGILSCPFLLNRESYVIDGLVSWYLYFIINSLAHPAASLPIPAPAPHVPLSTPAPPAPHAPPVSIPSRPQLRNMARSIDSSSTTELNTSTSTVDKSNLNTMIVD